MMHHRPTLGAPDGARRVHMHTGDLERLLVMAWSSGQTTDSWGLVAIVLTAWRDAIYTAGVRTTDTLVADLEWLTDICHTREAMREDEAAASARLWTDFRRERVANV